MKYSPIILLALLTLAAPGTAQVLQDNMSFEELATSARELTSGELEIPEVRRAYGLAFYQPGVPGSLKGEVCLYKEEDAEYGYIAVVLDGTDLYEGEWFSPVSGGRSWFSVGGPGGLQVTGSWEQFSAAVVAGQWVQLGPDILPYYGSVKGQQLSFNNTCN